MLANKLNILFIGKSLWYWCGGLFSDHHLCHVSVLTYQSFGSCILPSENVLPYHIKTANNNVNNKLRQIDRGK